MKEEGERDEEVRKRKGRRKKGRTDEENGDSGENGGKGREVLREARQGASPKKDT